MDDKNKKKRKILGMTAQSFVVTPEALIFRKTNVKDVDTLDVTVKNTSKKSIKIRFQLPQKSFFSLSTEQIFMIPPGLDATVKITHHSLSKNVEKSVLKVLSPNETIEIPIISHPPSPNVQFKTHFCNLGIITNGASKVQKFGFTNFGTKPGNYKIICDASVLNYAEILPKQGVIGLNRTVDATLTFHPNRTGTYNFNIYLEVEGNVDIIRPINIKAEVIDQTLYLKYPDDKLDYLDFGQIFNGQKKVLSFQIINNSSSKRSFTISPPIPAKMNNSPGKLFSFLGQNENKDKLNVMNKENINSNVSSNFSFDKFKGEIQPNSSTNILVIFSTNKSIGMDNSEIMHSAYSEVYITGTDIILPLKMIGSGINIGFTISCVDFVFEKVQIKKSSVKTFSITNDSSLLPIQFSIKQIAYFHFLPCSGTIQPNESKEIKITFTPKSLGLFNVSTNIVFFQNLLSRSINLIGESIDISSLQTQINSNLLNPPIEQNGKKSNPKPRFKKLKKGINPNSKNIYLQPENALTEDELEQKKQKRKIFDNYLMEMRQNREMSNQNKLIRNEAKKNAHDIIKNSKNQYTEKDMHDLIVQQINLIIEKENNPITLGLTPFEGLIPPEPSLPKANLTVFEPTYSPNNNYNRYPHLTKNRNTKAMIKKKFKPKPTKKIEINECSKKLNESQLLLIIPSSQTINFGEVSIYSSTIKHFQLTNNTQLHILAEIFTPKEVSKSTPKSQVIPPNKTAEFDIILDTSSVGNKMCNFQYKINGYHTYSVAALGQVSPIDVVLSAFILYFNFKERKESNFFEINSPKSNNKVFESEFQNSVSQQLTLQNNSNSVAKYEIKGFDSIFHSSKKHGDIQPNSSISLEIIYTPDQTSHHERMIDLTIFGGESKTIKLVGDTGKPIFTLNKRLIDFGIITFGSKVIDVIELENEGNDDGFFNISHNFVNILSISPSKGRLKKHSKIQFQLEVNCQKPGKFEIPVVISLCGMPPLQFNIKGNSAMPQISFSCEDCKNNIIDFGKVFLGSILKKTISLSNTGLIPATLVLDMKNYTTNFSIFFSSKQITEITEENSCSSKNSYSISDKKAMKSNSILEVNENSNSYAESMYQIFLKSNQSTNFDLVYQANQTGKTSFNLPLKIKADVAPDQTILQPLILAEAVKAPLSASTLDVYFGSVSLYNPLNPNNKPKTKSIILTNNSISPVSFKLTINSDVFLLNKTEGTLKPAESITIFAQFKPKLAIPYSILLPLYAIKDSEEILVAQIQLTGSGTSRMFVPSTNFLSLPIVPLGIQAEAEIDILNIGCIPTELFTSIVLDKKQFPIEISFPKGNVMKFNTTHLPIKISYISSKPASFTTMIAVYDKIGNSSTFTISVTTDNSIFTLYNFLLCDNYKIQAGDGKPLSVSIKDINNPSYKTNFLTSFLSINDFRDINPVPSLLTDDFIQFLVHFLNECVLTNPIRKFPKDLVENGPGIISEIITNISGKKPGNELLSISKSFNSIKNTKVNKDISKERFTLIQNLMKFLKSHGAMLSTINPEFLLSRSDFSNIMKDKITKYFLGIDFYGAPDISTFNKSDIDSFIKTEIFNSKIQDILKVLNSYYHSISIESWTIIILQIIKLYMFGKLLDNDAFYKLPGVKPALEVIRTVGTQSYYKEVDRSTQSLNSSNLYSPAECLLLKWCSIHYCNVCRCTTNSIINFNELRNPKILLSIFSSHFPDKCINIPNDNEGTEFSNNDFQEISNLLKQINLNFFNNETILESDNPIIYALFAQQLMTHLPYYLPSSIIEFQAPLNHISKHILLISNPSNAYITYTVGFEGSSNFHIKEKTFQLLPFKTYELVVEYFSKSHNSEKALLTLIPSHPMIPLDSTQSASINNDQLFSPKPPSQQTKTPRRNMKTSCKSSKLSKDQYHQINLVKSSNSASPLVIEMRSIVVYTIPYKTEIIEGPLYEVSNIGLPILNITKQKGTFKLYFKTFEILDSGKKNDCEISTQIKDFMNNPCEHVAENKNSDFESIIMNFCPFVFETDEIFFNEDVISDESAENQFERTTLNIEFVPICMKSYRCLILLRNENLGEILYEIIGNVTPPQQIQESISCKTVSNTPHDLSLSISCKNNFLFKAIAYVQVKSETMNTFISKDKLSNMVLQRSRDISTVYMKNFKSVNFLVSLSSSFFKLPSENYQTTKNIFSTNRNIKTYFQIDNLLTKQLHLTFSPTTPGKFPCKLVLQSDYDVRIYAIDGIAKPETKFASIEFETFAGVESSQTIPIENPSDINWSYKIVYSGFEGFSGPSNFIVHPHSTYNFNIIFFSSQTGSFDGQVTLKNRTKEFDTIYSLSAISKDPPALKKLSYHIKARNLFVTDVELPIFSSNGHVKISSTMPLLKFIEKNENIISDSSKSNQAQYENEALKPNDLSNMNDSDSIEINKMHMDSNNTKNIDSTEPANKVNINNNKNENDNSVNTSNECVNNVLKNNSESLIYGNNFVNNNDSIACSDIIPNSNPVLFNKEESNSKENNKKESDDKEESNTKEKGHGKEESNDKEESNTKEKGHDKEESNDNSSKSQEIRSHQPKKEILLCYSNNKPVSMSHVKFSLYSLRSGFSIGTLTFTDLQTGTYVWYVIEVNVDPPDPEETVYVQTTIKSPVDITIPVKNPRNYPVTFEVTYIDKELSGEKFITVDSNSKSEYILHLLPLIASERITAISFYNDDEGEYVYNIDIQVNPPDVTIMAPLYASIGSTESSIITLENPLDHTTIFKIENDNDTNFHIITTNHYISIPPNTRLPIEIRFIPTSINTKAVAHITFVSRSIGDCSYRFVGYGKPPQPSEQILVESVLQVGTSKQINFSNPFPFMARFEIILKSDSGAFSILSKKKMFTLYNYGEERQIAFSFLPRSFDDQYSASLVVATLGIEPTIRWVYPIIGNPIYGNEGHQITIIRGKANNEIFHRVTLVLRDDKLSNPNFQQISDDAKSQTNTVASFDSNSISNNKPFSSTGNYQFRFQFQSEFEWMKKIISVLSYENLESSKLRITFKLTPKKQIFTSFSLIVDNSLGQSWNFRIGVNIERGNISHIVSIESQMNVSTSINVKLTKPISYEKEFKAYFLANSSQFLSVTPEATIFGPSFDDEPEMPFEITFYPKNYGKNMKGILVIEAEDEEFLFEVHGRMPGYIPPNVKRSGKIDTTMPEGAKPLLKSTRNFIKENINNIKILQGAIQAKKKSSNQNKLKTKVTRLNSKMSE